MIRHTGYFHFRCSNCSKKFASKPVQHACNGRYYIERILDPIFKQENIEAYVCELCNYVRFHEAEMEMHLNNEHEDGEAKAYKKFNFLSLPKLKKGRRPLVKKSESSSEVKMENVFEVGYETARPNHEEQHCDAGCPIEENYDFNVLTKQLEEICNDASDNDDGEFTINCTIIISF